MPLSYANIPLLLDQEGQVERWLDQFSPLRDLRLFGASSIAMNDRHLLPRNPSKQGAALAVPNWSEPPALRINTLFWPCTGATRFARFVGLTDDLGLAQIRLSLTSSAPADYGNLVISEGNSHRKRSLTVKMWPLPPRKVAVDSRAGANGLWLLPLVDDRWLWQTQPCTLLTASHFQENFTTADWTWDKFFNGAGVGASGFEGSIAGFFGWDADTISADYFRPDGQSFDEETESIAVALDAAAESVGMRIVKGFDSTTYLMNYGRSASYLTDSLAPSADLNETGYEIIAGGTNDKHVQLRTPQVVRVRFPTWWSNGQYFESGVTFGDFTYDDAGGLEDSTPVHTAYKMIRTTAEGEYENSLANPNPTNRTDINTLANKIASDWLNWQTKDYDYTFNGVKKWKPNGYDDWFILQFQSNAANGEPLTRVFSHPYEFGTSRQYQAFRFTRQRGQVEARGASQFLNTDEAIDFTEFEGDSRGFSCTGNVVKARSAGLYVVTISGLLSGGSAGAPQPYISLQKNAVELSHPSALRMILDGGTATNSRSMLLRLDADDELRLYHSLNGGSPSTITNASLLIRS